MQDRFTKIYKLNHSAESNTDYIKPRWKYYDSMFFLKDMKNVGPTVCKLNIQKSSKPQKIEKHDDIIQTIQTETYINNSQTNANLNKSNKSSESFYEIYHQKPSNNGKFENYPDIDFQASGSQKQHHSNTTTSNIQNNEDPEEDENFHYLMSFLPYLQEVPKYRRLSVMCKLQNVFLDEQEENYN